MTDVLVPPTPGRIDYQCDLPLATGMGLFPESETSEIYLRDSAIRSLVLPLGLSEWQSGQTSDNFVKPVDGALQRRQSIDGAGLCSAWFVDLCPRRSVQPRTWRQLAVGENLELVSADHAVAYRVQIGTEQWVIYRAVASSGNRTFMGENFSRDFFIGRFDPHGDVEELLQISE